MLSNRYQYYLQLKKDVLEGRIPCSIEQAIRLAGLAVQGIVTVCFSGLCFRISLLIEFKFHIYLCHCINCILTLPLSLLVLLIKLLKVQYHTKLAELVGLKISGLSFCQEEEFQTLLAKM